MGNNKDEKWMRSYGWLFLSIVLVRITVSLVSGYFLKEKANELLPLFLSQISYVIPALIFIKKKPSLAGFKNTMRLKKLSLASFSLIPFMALLVLPIVGFVNGISMLFTENQMVNSMDVLMPNISYLPMLFVAAFVPAICEESVYRGVLLTGFEKGGMWKGIIYSAFAFALLHLNLNQFMYAFVFGMIMGLVVEISGSVFASMLIHFCMNGMSISMMYLMERFGKLALNEVNQMSGQMATISLVLAIAFYGFISIFAIAGMIGLLFLIAKIEGREKSFSVLNPFSKWREKPYVSRVLSIPLIIAMGICAVVIVLVEVW